MIANSFSSCEVRSPRLLAGRQSPWPALTKRMRQEWPTLCDFPVLTSEGRSAYFLTLLERSSRHFMNKSGPVSTRMRHQVERNVLLGSSPAVQATLDMDRRPQTLLEGPAIPSLHTGWLQAREWAGQSHPQQRRYPLESRPDCQLRVLDRQMVASSSQILE